MSLVLSEPGDGCGAPGHPGQGEPAAPELRPRLPGTPGEPGAPGSGTGERERRRPGARHRGVGPREPGALELRARAPGALPAPQPGLPLIPGPVRAAVVPPLLLGGDRSRRPDATFEPPAGSAALLHPQERGSRRSPPRAGPRVSPAAFSPSSPLVSGEREPSPSPRCLSRHSPGCRHSAAPAPSRRGTPRWSPMEPYRDIGRLGEARESVWAK